MSILSSVTEQLRCQLINYNHLTFTTTITNISWPTIERGAWWPALWHTGWLWGVSAQTCRSRVPCQCSRPRIRCGRNLPSHAWTTSQPTVRSWSSIQHNIHTAHWGIFIALQTHDKFVSSHLLEMEPKNGYICTNLDQFHMKAKCVNKVWSSSCLKLFHHFFPQYCVF